jgi:uncharacterized protein with von Willebrand factor type A (vWA) domain
MIPIFAGIAAAAAFTKSVVERGSNYLFGSRVRPRSGTPVHCALGVALDHSGIYAGSNQIVELEGEGDIRSISPQEFVDSSFVRGSTIYVACDKKTGVALGCRQVAQRASSMDGERRDYHVLIDNCHQFTSGCITGDFEAAENFFAFLTHTIEQEMNGGRSISWLVWDYANEDEPSEDGLDEQLEQECGELDYELVQGHEIAGEDSVRPELHEELRSWQQQATTEMREKFAARFAELAGAEASLAEGNSGREAIRGDLQALDAADTQADNAFWKKELAQCARDEDLQPLRMAIQAHWRKSLERQQNEYYLNEIARRREKLKKELDARLVAMQQIAEVARDLGMQPGLLWDQTKGVGARTDLQTLQRWADYLKNNEGVKRLSELLGRMRRYSESQRMELIKSTTTYQVSVPDVEAKSEIVGITQGRDIDHILPQELALLADPDTEILFDLKFAEGRLMSFDYAGTIEKSYEHEQEELAQVTEQDKLGPMIICVDTSGSMSGEPESVAKSIALALAMKSMEQKRDCYLISFSTGIEVRDLSAQRGLAELLDFLQMSFGGGTDSAPALHHAMQKMGEENYARADLLMISDFGMPAITPDLKQQMDEARTRDCKFYALNIGATQGRAIQHKEFDAEWQYNPATMGIKELTGIVEQIV